MFTKRFIPFVLVIVAALTLGACNNPMAAKPGVWYNPFSWGDKTAAQTAEEILQSAQDAKTIRDAQAAATAMAGGTVPTVSVITTPVGVDSIAANNGDQRAVGSQGSEDRVTRMLRLNDIKDISAWLEAAGLPYNWTAGYFDARQPEEETLSLSDGSTRIVKSGMQVDVRGLYVQWPACLTTDKPSRVITQNNTHSYQPDPTNGSKLYTNATTSGDGKVTVWIDCSNWGQLDPTNP